MKKIYHNIINSKQKNIAVLIDPDKQNAYSLGEIVDISEHAGVDLFLVGGSLISNSINTTISIIKEKSKIPVIIFPGSLLQIVNEADGLLLLSLISGRNPEFLIGNHVVAAPFLKKSKLEIISTSYMLIDGGKKTSVEYMSNTKPIPADKTDIAVATAIAGELIGNKMIYLEAGSGAVNPVSEEIISKVKNNVNIPVIVGGGLNNNEKIDRACKAGADIVVVGTAFEHNRMLIRQFADIVHKY